MAEEEIKADITNKVEPEVVEGEDVEALKQAVAEEKAKAEANLAGWQRAQADFINYKRRSEQEKEELSKFASSILMLNLLPVRDDFERALASIPPELGKSAWVDGVRLVEQKLRASLEAQGLSQIEALGKPFDPSLHEALGQVPGKEGVVIQELKKGYKLYDRLLRPATVMVGSGEEAEGKREA